MEQEPSLSISKVNNINMETRTDLNNKGKGKRIYPQQQKAMEPSVPVTPVNNTTNSQNSNNRESQLIASNPENGNANTTTTTENTQDIIPNNISTNVSSSTAATSKENSFSYESHNFYKPKSSPNDTYSYSSESHDGKQEKRGAIPDNALYRLFQPIPDPIKPIAWYHRLALAAYIVFQLLLCLFIATCAIILLYGGKGNKKQVIKPTVIQTDSGILIVKEPPPNVHPVYFWESLSLYEIHFPIYNNYENDVVDETDTDEEEQGKRKLSQIMARFRDVASEFGDNSDWPREGSNVLVFYVNEVCAGQSTEETVVVEEDKAPSSSSLPKSDNKNENKNINNDRYVENDILKTRFLDRPVESDSPKYFQEKQEEKYVVKFGGKELKAINRLPHYYNVNDYIENENSTGQPNKRAKTVDTINTKEEEKKHDDDEEEEKKEKEEKPKVGYKRVFKTDLGSLVCVRGINNQLMETFTEMPEYIMTRCSKDSKNKLLKRDKEGEKDGNKIDDEEDEDEDEEEEEESLREITQPHIATMYKWLISTIHEYIVVSLLMLLFNTFLVFKSYRLSTRVGEYYSNRRYLTWKLGIYFYVCATVIMSLVLLGKVIGTYFENIKQHESLFNWWGSIVQQFVFNGENAQTCQYSNLWVVGSSSVTRKLFTILTIHVAGGLYFLSPICTCLMIWLQLGF